VAETERLGRRRTFEPREDLVIEIRVAVAVAAGVSFDGTHDVVPVCSEQESRAIVQIIDEVVLWLAAAVVSPARLSLADRTFAVVGPVPIGGAG
jgi:hypothetical protein